MAASGLSLHFAAVQQYGRFRSEADIGFDGSKASQKRARIYFGSHVVATNVSSVPAGADFKIFGVKAAAAAEVYGAAH